MKQTGATTLTWMLSFPNSFARLCDNARSPNLPAAKPDVWMKIDAIEVRGSDKPKVYF